jgi:putative PEP-CTERM system TPR-repeat lipoprotein
MSINKQLAVPLLLSLLFAGGLTACSKSQDTQALISEAKAYQKKGEAKAAIIQLKNALQKNPDDREARQLLGIIYHESGDAQSAEKELRKALSLGASPAEVLPTLGKVLLLQGQFQKVLDDVKPPEGAKPDPQLLAVRGNAYLGLEKRKEAKESFDLALKEAPDSADALIGLAKLSLLEGDVNAAMARAEQAATRNPANVDVLLFKGDLLRSQRKLDEALAAYAKVTELNPGNITAYVSRAHIHINAGKFDAAKAELDAARKQDSKSLAITYSQALLEFSQGKHAAALESIQQVLRVAPEHMPSVLLAGAIQYALGSTQQAEQHLKRYLERSPGNAYASKLLVATLVKNGDTARAIKVLTPLLKEGEKDPQVLTLAGETYMRAREYSKATEYFEKASALAPDAAIIRTALGMSRLAQGENARGIAELELATNLDPKPAQAAILLVMTHIRLKEYDKALAAVGKLEKAQPDNPLLQNLKGAAYLGKKDIAAARSSFQKALTLQSNYFPAVASLVQIDMQEKKPDAAKKRLESFLAVDKKNVQAMTALARLALAQGRKEEATTWLERASNENPDELKPAILLAAHYLQLGEKQKAFALAQKLQASNPANAEVLELLAQTQVASNDLPAALQSYKKLATLSPDSPVVQFRTASVFMAMQNPNAAGEALKAALALKPDYLEAQLALANLEVRKGNHDQALKIAKQIQKQQQKGGTGYVLEGDVLLAQKKPELAFKAYEQAFALNKSGQMMIKLHEALKQSGKEKEGQTRLAQWLKEHPEDIATRLYLATVHLGNQQNKEAIEQYQLVLQADPKNVVALNNLALAYQQSGDSRALEFAEKAYAQAPESPAVLDTLGWILVEQGNISRGLPLLQKAATLVPAAPDIHYHLAQGLMKLGDKVKARKELEQLLESGKSFAKADEARTLLKQLQ